MNRANTAQALVLSLANPGVMQVLADGTSLINLEQLSFYGGTGGDRVTGGALNDEIAGNGGNDTLYGLSGNDALRGGAGNDTGYGGAGNDLLYDDAGNDRLYGGDGHDSLDGFTGNDLIFGDIGNDAIFIDAGEGVDTVDGGAGTDFLNLDRTGSAQAVIWSLINPAIAQILADGTRIVNVERMHFDGGSGNDRVTGGALEDDLSGGLGGDTLVGGAGQDDLFGGAGHDRLDGGTGVDTLRGGTGNDLFVVDSNLDLVWEDAGDGIDTVQAAVDYDLTGSQIAGLVENLVLSGAAVAATGNSLDNLLYGNLLANTLTGGAGADGFMFRFALTGGVDQITDFSVADDTLRLEDAVFAALTPGALAAVDFVSGVAAADA